MTNLEEEFRDYFNILPPMMGEERLRVTVDMDRFLQFTKEKIKEAVQESVREFIWYNRQDNLRANLFAHFITTRDRDNIEEILEDSYKGYLEHLKGE